MESHDLVRVSGLKISLGALEKRKARSDKVWKCGISPLANLQSFFKNVSVPYLSALDIQKL